MAINRATHFGSDFNSLIPELAQWNDGRGIDVVTWIHGLGSYEHAIAYAEIFWPDFVEYQRCVFLIRPHKDIKDIYDGFMIQTNGNKVAVEKVINHQHISDMFPNQRPTEAQVIHLGRLIKDIWQTKLRRDFPDREIIVEFYEQDCEGIWDYQITIYQLVHDKELRLPP